MYGKEVNGQITQTYGLENIMFSPTVYQPAHTLSEEQRQEFGVVYINEPVQPSYNPITHTIAAGVYEKQNGAWTKTWAVTPRALSEAKERMKDALEVTHRNQSEAGVVINDIRVSTDARALALLVGAKQGGKSTRKFATRNGRAELTKVQFDALVTGVDDFLQACQDRYYDLFGLIEAAQDVPSLSLIDLAAGWP